MFEAPYPPYDPVDRAGFSYTTVVTRWPIILTGIVDRLHGINHDLVLRSQDDTGDRHDLEAKISEGKSIIEAISKLKYDMSRDHPLQPLASDGEALVDVYNAELDHLAQSGKNTWFTAPWLFAECYLYRLLRSYFTQTQHWRTYDPFFTQKEDTFHKSGASIFQIATIMHEIEVERDLLQSDPDKLGVLFKEMIQCVFGKSYFVMDLSLLTHLSLSDIEKLQTVGKEAQQARREFILRDDQDVVWSHLRHMKTPQRVDFVLDNAGFELFTDFVFADFLVTYTPYVSRVVFHPKLIPWFVSDVTPPDFVDTISHLVDNTFFSEPVDAASKVHLETLVSRWKKYIASDFWTSPWPYWDMETHAPELWTFLADSGLVIFKGDLNYRKLTGDIKWPASTTFAAALGPLAGSFPLLSLRTNKADVVVGIDQDVADKLDASGIKWRTDGRYALVSFLPARVHQE